MLDSSAQASWKKHLADCTECQGKLKAIQRVKSTLQSLPLLEGNPLEQLQPPVFIPVIRPVLPLWGILGGFALGMLFVGSLLILKPIHLPMRVVSNVPSDQPGQRLEGGQLEPGASLNSAPSPGDIDLEIPDQVIFRLKPGTTISWQEMDRLWILGGRPNIVMHVMQGEVLARTHDRFWGSKLQVRTPSASATVKGTAFSIKVDPQQNATTLKVLAGAIFFSPYLDPVGVNVQAGQASRVQGRKFAPPAENLSVQEKRELMEIYRIGSPTGVALVIGAGPERLEELMAPALLHLMLQARSQLQPFLVPLVREINSAILEERLPSEANRFRMLERVVHQEITEPELAVPLRLYLGACAAHLGQPFRAQLHFEWAIKNCPSHPLAPLALAAAAALADEELEDPQKAMTYFEQILRQHPKSPEAEHARAFQARLISRRVRGI